MELVTRYIPARIILWGCFLLSCVTCYVAKGQQGYQFENYTTTNGLSDNRITCFFKDHTGYMWIGTENGLNRFDGHNFLVYYPGNTKKHISNPYINDIEEDRNNRLWVATNSGLNVIDTRNDSTYIFLPDKDAHTQKNKRIPSDLIWDTHIDQKNRVWIAADTRDLCYYDPGKQIFTFFPWQKFIEEYLPHRKGVYNSIRKIYPKSADELWLGTAAGLFSFTISTGTFHAYASKEADHFIQLLATPGNPVVYFIQNPGNVLQVLSTISGHKKDIPWESIPPVSFDKKSIAYPDSRQWLPAGKDVLEINTATGQVYRLQHETDNTHSLPNGLIRTVYRESNGLVWVGTSNGMGKFNPGMNFFHYTPLWPPEKEEAVFENDIFRTDHAVHTVFYSAQDDHYYISSPKNNCLVLLNNKTGERKTLYEINGIPLKNCSVIYEDSKGMLWILAGTHAFRYDRGSKKFSLTGFQSDKRNRLFTDMTEDAAGNLWIACYNDGLYCYSPVDGHTIKFTDRKSFNSIFPTTLYADHANRQLWIGTFSTGLYRYDMATKTFHHYIQETAKTGHMRSSLITDITADKKGRIWIASFANGVASCPPLAGDNEFTYLTAVDGLPDNNVYALATGRNGLIWGTSYKGLFTINPGDKKIKKYDQDLGLGFTGFYSPLNRSSTGDLSTGIVNGFLHFNPDSISYKSPGFPVVITAVKTKNNDTATTAGIDFSPTRLSYSDNEISFSFAALSFALPGQTRYEYRLEGLDKTWINSGNHTEASYNNLAPGSYVFRVRAIDFTGRASANEAVFSFRILPPWWQTWWFRVLAAIAIITTAIAAYRWRVSNIKRKAALQLQLAEMKEQALRAQMNPHFIFNSLNAIQELIVTESYTSSYEYLSKFSRLLRMVLNNSEKNFVSLSEEMEMGGLYLELESLRFKHSFLYTITADKKIDTDSTAFPPLLIQPFMENAIWHGLLPKEGEKKLTVYFEEKDGLLVCTITDNGIGREKAALIRMNKMGSAHTQSKGISLVQQRLDAIRASGTRIAELDIQNNNEGGTIVRIKLSSPNSIV